VQSHSRTATFAVWSSNVSETFFGKKAFMSNV